MIKLRLLLSSYVPLFVLLAIRFDSVALRVSCLVIALAGALFARSLIRAQDNEQPYPMRLTSVRDEGVQVAAYLMTYLLPFLMVSEPGVRDVVAYGAFLVMIGVVLAQTNYLQVNPLLAMAGFRLYEVSADTGWHGFMISRGISLEAPRTYLVVDIISDSLRRASSETSGGNTDV